MSLEIRFVTSWNGGNGFATKLVIATMIVGFGTLVGTKDLGDDKMAFGNLVDGIEAFWNAIVFVCIKI
jgi:hypothetical protein